ncbi:hypothetical protein MNBD_GAMMA22-2620 [hydrothermal vent metagenome]|uniref:Uncharacterized protein n=1 Tax=hydrothermal vent metagenome TaxID=652676 RepID=A0A3B0ZUR4_9ZZZZ
MSQFRPYCYSQRMLNPFRGVMNVIEAGNADAVTTDGIHWTLYLHDEVLQGMAFDGDVRIETPDIRFATWSRKEGLCRAPLISTMEYGAIQQSGLELLAIVKQHADKVPFALKDNYELWLLDKYCDKPLALLHSACYENELLEYQPRQWRPGIKCQHSFNSRLLEKQNSNALNHADWLAQQVDQSAGNQNYTQWFLRDEQGNGVGLESSSHVKCLAGRNLTRDEFPILMLNDDWLEEDTSAVVKEFFSWQSPFLLLLQHLTDESRVSLENLASKHVNRLFQMQRLLPKVIDHQVIKSALVEAVIRKSNDDTEENEFEHSLFHSGHYF